MARIFLLLAVIVGLLWWLRGRVESSRARRPADPAGTGQRPAAPGAPAQQAMVQCAQCGVHLPEGEAIGFRGLHYCRTSHLPRTPDTVDTVDGARDRES